MSNLIHKLIWKQRILHIDILIASKALIRALSCWATK